MYVVSSDSMEYCGLWSENTRMPMKPAKYTSMATVTTCDVTVTAVFPAAANSESEEKNVCRSHVGLE